MTLCAKRGSSMVGIAMSNCPVRKSAGDGSPADVRVWSMARIWACRRACASVSPRRR